MRLKKLVHSKPSSKLTEMYPLGMDAKSLAADFKRYFSYTLGRDRKCNSAHYPYDALVLALRDRLMERWKATRAAVEKADSRRTFYLSLEFLMGRTLGNAMLNLGITGEADKALAKFGIELEEIADCERDAGLGNGGLGRLAACFLDSCATLRLPVTGYGIRYEYGMFRQTIIDGYQVEEPDHWLMDGNPWEMERPELTQRVRFGGKTEFFSDGNGGWRVLWVDTNDVFAVPYDIPIPGFDNGIVNTLRLWSASATDEFDLREFNAGSYTEAVAAKNAAEHITMVLYPNDSSENGKELRLRQQYFLASASLQDVLHQWTEVHGKNFKGFADKHCFQLNDTHPAVSVAEMMRLLMDEHGLNWDAAWGITSGTMAYTNHTLLPEALERWPVRIFQQLLPRHLQIIYEINARFLAEVSNNWPGDTEKLRRMSIIEEGHEPQIRMAYLAIVGSFSVNGVAELHSRLLRQGLFQDFNELWPERFNNKTNGVTPRRWLAWCNPLLNALITEKIGKDWVADFSQIQLIAKYAADKKFQAQWMAVRQQNKAALARLVKSECGVAFKTEALFDVQVKRIHEYKRQSLNVLHVIHLYDRIKRGDTSDWTPRAVLIGGKAAPGYRIAKDIIKLISNVAQLINADPRVGDLLKVAFFPNYRVSAMEVICAGADLSEQISTAGKEASGTGNMKFMMNGSVTIGTLDGANIEIRDEVGEDNFFLFGMAAEEVEQRLGNYDPNALIDESPNLNRVMQLLESGHFNQFEPGIFDHIIAAIRNPHDQWMVAADFDSFVSAQQRAAAAYQNESQWCCKSISNTAASGRFSTDRTMQEYNADIWRLEPLSRVAPSQSASGQ